MTERRRFRSLLLAAAFLAGSCVALQAQDHMAFTAPALRVLRLTYQQAGTQEFGACGIGRISGDTVVIERVVPADVEASHDSTMVTVEPCSGTWGRYFGDGVVAAIHSHPGPEPRCSHFLILESGARTRVPTSDWWRFRSYAKEPISLIWCGTKVAWLNREGDEFLAPVGTIGPPPDGLAHPAVFVGMP